MHHRLASNALTVVVSDKGAEIQSIVSDKTGEEYIWQGDPAVWGSRSPVLFPIIGGLKDGAYQYEGKSYKLGKHGFVRGQDFTRIDGGTPSGTDTLVFEYTDNSATREVYPFAFSFKTAFTLRDDTLAVAYIAENHSDGDMYFSTGAHEGCRCPRRADESFDDYYLEFDRDGTYDSTPVNAATGLLTGESFTVIDGGRMLPLQHALFENDALIFQHIESKKVSIKSHKSPSVIEVTYDAPHLGVWTKVGAPFICIEPWCGLPDYENASGLLTEKPGIIRLSAGEKYVFNHTIRVIEE